MLNVISVMGRLVAAPELRKTASGVSVTSFTLACERNFAKAGEKRETDFLEVQAWRGAAEFACRYFKKGQLVAVNGSLQTRQYTAKDGQKRKAYEIVADNLHFAESAKREKGEENLREPDATDFDPIDESADLPF